LGINDREKCNQKAKEILRFFVAERLGERNGLRKNERIRKGREVLKIAIFNNKKSTFPTKCNVLLILKS
jgi:hypothetical protein